MSSYYNQYGPWALVTGASSGIGKAISEQLASQGFNIVAVARNPTRLDQLKTQLEANYKVKVNVIVQDLCSPDSSDIIAEKTRDLDIGLLVANAGSENSGAFIGNQANKENDLIAININSPMTLSHIFAKRLVKRGKGGILFISSLFGYQGVPHVANYSASKAYILTLGEALNVELKPLGVDVTVLSPGLTKTSMSENMPINFSKMPITSHKAETVARIGLKALGKKATVVPGLINKIYAWENRFIPRSWPVNLFGFLVKRALTDK